MTESQKAAVGCSGEESSPLASRRQRGAALQPVQLMQMKTQQTTDTHNNASFPNAQGGKQYHEQWKTLTLGLALHFTM